MVVYIITSGDYRQQSGLTLSMCCKQKKFPCQVAEPTGAAEEGRLEMEDLMPRSLKFDECWIGETPATQESFATPSFGGVVDESPSPTNADPSPSPTNASIAGLADEAGLINISPWR